MVSLVSLGTHASSVRLQPRRGCGPEPKVAVLSYLGNCSVDPRATPTGLRPYSLKDRNSAPSKSSGADVLCNPERFRRNPFGLAHIFLVPG
jgi:hypothetical protein